MTDDWGRKRQRSLPRCGQRRVCDSRLQHSKVFPNKEYIHYQVKSTKPKILAQTYLWQWFLPSRPALLRNRGAHRCPTLLAQRCGGRVLLRISCRRSRRQQALWDPEGACPLRLGLPLLLQHRHSHLVCHKAGSGMDSPCTQKHSHRLRRSLPMVHPSFPRARLSIIFGIWSRSGSLP